MTLFLTDLISVERFKRALETGHISERAHERDPELRVYSYTPKTQFSGYWTPETRLARGLILRVPGGILESATVEGRGLPKFFTIEQTESDWGRPKLVDDDESVVVDEAPELSWDAPAFVAEKLNGALGLAYFGPEGLAIATKGSFGSTEAHIGSRIIAEKLSPAQQERFRELFGGSTALFELITPERPHPVDYGDLEDLIFLGFVKHTDGTWTPAEETHPLASELGFSVAPRAEHRTLHDAVRAPYRENTEGLVVSIQEGEVQHLYKVKPSEYLEIRRAFYATETVDMVGVISSMSSEELEGLTAEKIPLPKGLRNAELHRRKLQEEIIVPLQAKLAEVRAAYAELRGTGELPSRAEFAKLVKGASVTPAFLFSAYDEELQGGKVLAAGVLKQLIRGLKKLNG